MLIAYQDTDQAHSKSLFWL